MNKYVFNIGYSYRKKEESDIYRDESSTYVIIEAESSREAKKKFDDAFRLMFEKFVELSLLK